MQNFFTSLIGVRQLVLAAGLLASGSALAQTQPAVVYALGTVTQGFTFGGITYPTGSQTLTALDPSTGTFSTSTTLASPSVGYLITGITSGQVLVGIDYRTANGDLYALGFNAQEATAANAQLYTLRVTNTPSATTATLTPVGAPIRLELTDNNRQNTRGVIPNIGFDFNPRVDRIRVVAPNGANYRLNPSNGQVVPTTISPAPIGTDGNLFYASGAVAAPAASPYVGTAAYTNSRLGLRGTTLYDIDVTNTNAVLSTQNPPNNGQLNPVAGVSFFLPSSSGGSGPFPITSPTVGLGLDVYNTNTAYLIEARLRDNTETTVTAATRYTSNFYTFNLNSGRATLVANIIGNVTLYYSDIAVPILAPKAWTGQVSSAWGNPNNWYPVGVPTSSDDVVITGNGTFVPAANTTVANQPVVSDAQQAASVTLSSGALLTTNDGATLTLAGDFVNNDSQVAGTGTGTIVLAGTSGASDISGNTRTNFWNLSIGTAGATTSGAVAVQRALTVNNGTLTIGSDQTFTLLSSAAGTAYLVNTNGGTVSGTATVQRYITPTNNGPGYRHYSSPVSGNTVADFATTGFSPVVNAAYNTAAMPPQVTPFPTIFSYDQSRLGLTNSSPEFDKGFLSPTATSDALTTGLGYTVNINSSELVDFVGPLNQAASYSRGSLGRGTQATAGYHLLGNPYPGAIDWTTVFNASTGMENGLYVYKSSGQYVGTYASYVNGQGSNGGSSNIPLAQGFLTRVASGQTGTVNFPTAARTNQPETALFQRPAADPRPTLALTLRSATAANQTRIYFEQGATAAFEAPFDAHYLTATHGLDLASDISTEALSINGLPALTTAVTVPLRVHAATAGTYTLTVDELLNLPTGYRAYFRDASTGTVTDLTTTPSLSLTLDPALAATGRYSVIFSNAAPLAAAPAALAATVAVYPNPAHGSAVLLLPSTLRGQQASLVQVFNSLGQVVLSRTVSVGGADQVELPLSGLASGVYTVRASTTAGTVARQLVVK